MHTIPNETGAGRRRWREHSAEFKAQVVAACSAPGVSIAAVAMANGVNANRARRWVVNTERRSGARLATTASGVAPMAFMPLGLPPATPAPVDIRIELRRCATANPGELALRPCVRVRGLAARVVAVIRIDAVWLAVEPIGMRAGAERLLASWGSLN